MGEEGAPLGAIEETFEFRIVLQKDETGPRAKLGLSLVQASPTAVEITSIREGCAREWNIAHPYRSLMLTDRIISVNGVRGRAEKIVQELEKSRRLALVVQRPKRMDDVPIVTVTLP